MSDPSRADNRGETRLVRLGLYGSIVAALCCFTPLLVVVLAGLGLSAVTGWLDYALFPMLFASLGVLAQALWLRAGRPGANPRRVIIVAAVALSALLFWLQFRYAPRISLAAALAVAAYWFWLDRTGRRTGGADGAPGPVDET